MKPKKNRHSHASKGIPNSYGKKSQEPRNQDQKRTFPPKRRFSEGSGPSFYEQEGAARSLERSFIKQHQDELKKLSTDSQTNFRPLLNPEVNESRGFFWRRKKAAAPTTEKSDNLSLDPWQEEALNAMQNGSNVIVDAPTTAGKTRVVEAFFRLNVGDPKFRACYTCPVKSLSNDKLREFRSLYGNDMVGIATGDLKENLQAPIIVATLESYRNSLLGIEPDLGRSLVVFDEYHYLQDEGRGSAWEEAIVLTPPNCQLLLLSASVANASSFAKWLENLFARRSLLVTVKERPVPLVNVVRMGKYWLDPKLIEESTLKPPRHPDLMEPIPHVELAQMAVDLVAMGMTPALVYSGKRLSCENIAIELARIAPLLTAEKKQLIQARMDQAQTEWKSINFLRKDLRDMIFEKGIAFHHSGLAPPARLAIESLVKEGLLHFCVATMGLSLGINFSVKSTLLSDGIRPGDSGFTVYPPSEVLQMTGRAGRRGKDLVGFSCWPNWEYYKAFGHAKREDCRSRLRTDPCTFLGLLSRGYTLGQIEMFYSKSFLKLSSPKTERTIITASTVAKELGVNALPCRSPVAERSRYLSEQNAKCYDCKLRPNCHPLQKTLNTNPLAKLHAHLHRINALEDDESLSPFGELARFFPQSGGLLLANMILREEINSQNLLTAVQLMAALSLAHYKSPKFSSTYQFPYKTKNILDNLAIYYPMEMFPDLYDQVRGQRGMYQYKEFNPLAGRIIERWSLDVPWQTLLRECSSDAFGPGDITALIYRCASYLQSLSQARIGDLSRDARDLRDHLLREPLQINF